MTTTTYLYRIYEVTDDQALLYVGITANMSKRLAQHRLREWGHEIGRVEVSVYATRELAHASERHAIRDERPRYNRIRYQTGFCRNIKNVDRLAIARRGRCVACDRVAHQIGKEVRKNGFWVFPTSEQIDALDLISRAERSLCQDSAALDPKQKSDLEALKMFAGYSHFSGYRRPQEMHAWHSNDEFWSCNVATTDLVMTLGETS